MFANWITFHSLSDIVVKFRLSTFQNFFTLQPTYQRNFQFIYVSFCTFCKKAPIRARGTLNFHLMRNEVFRDHSLLHLKVYPNPTQHPSADDDDQSWFSTHLTALLPVDKLEFALLMLEKQVFIVFNVGTQITNDDDDDDRNDADGDNSWIWSGGELLILGSADSRIPYEYR